MLAPLACSRRSLARAACSLAQLARAASTSTQATTRRPAWACCEAEAAQQWKRPAMLDVQSPSDDGGPENRHGRGDDEQPQTAARGTNGASARQSHWLLRLRPFLLSLLWWWRRRAVTASASERTKQPLHMLLKCLRLRVLGSLCCPCKSRPLHGHVALSSAEISERPKRKELRTQRDRPGRERRECGATCFASGTR